jgi:ornithine cyclodeaminase/alanine dehydrogenase-like protein (mu-crystallin family)
MAKNLQAKLPSTDTIRVYDINTQSVEKFTNDTKALGKGAAVEAASCVREAAENSVSCSSMFSSLSTLYFCLLFM